MWIGVHPGSAWNDGGAPRALHFRESDGLYDAWQRAVLPVLRHRFPEDFSGLQLAVCQNLVPLVNIKIAGKWMFIPLKMVLIGIDPYPTVEGLRCQLAMQPTPSDPDTEWTQTQTAEG